MCKPERSKKAQSLCLHTQNFKKFSILLVLFQMSLSLRIQSINRADWDDGIESCGQCFSPISRLVRADGEIQGRQSVSFVVGNW